MAILRVYSDLHCEFSYFDIPKPDDPNTILVLAGDIFTGKGVMRDEYLPKWSNMFKHVVFVLGNHDYYGSNITYLADKLKEQAKSLGNVHILDHDVIELEGIQFVGGTMWTSFNNDPYVKGVCQYSMNDYKQICIGPNYKKITANDTAFLHASFRGLLETVDFSKKTVVVTHHCPSIEFCDVDRYKDSAKEINLAYYTDMEREIKAYKPVMWIAGHTHKRVNKMLGSTWLYSNPRGYETSQWNELVNGFKFKEDIYV